MTALLLAFCLFLVSIPAGAGTVYVCGGVVFANSSQCAQYCGKTCDATDSSPSPQAVPCDTGSFRGFVYSPATGKTYAITNSGMTWEEAEGFARSRNSDLVMVRSEPENSLLAKAFGTLAWIGVSLKGRCPLGDYTCAGQGVPQTCSNGDTRADCSLPTDYGYANPDRNYRYVDGSSLTFSAWAEGEPDYVEGNEFYVAIGRDGRWRDLGGETHPAIVEFQGPLACVYPSQAQENPLPIKLPECEAGEPCWACVKDKNGDGVLEEDEIAKCIEGEGVRLCPFDAVLCTEHTKGERCPLGDYPCENGQCTRTGTCRKVEQPSGYSCTVTGESFGTLEECQASCYREGSCTSFNQPVEVSGPDETVSNESDRVFAQVAGAGDSLLFVYNEPVYDFELGFVNPVYDEPVYDPELGFVGHNYHTLSYRVPGASFSGSVSVHGRFRVYADPVHSRLKITNKDGDYTYGYITYSNVSVTSPPGDCCLKFYSMVRIWPCGGNKLCVYTRGHGTHRLAFSRKEFRCSLTGNSYSAQDECQSACRQGGECQEQTSSSWRCDLNGRSYPTQEECSDSCRDTAQCTPGSTTYECPLGDYPCVTNPEDGKKYCSDISCADTQNEGNYADVGDPVFDDKENDGPVDDKGNCLGTIYIFNGKGWACRSVDYLGGIGIDGGCCNKDKVLFGLINCKEEEKMLARLRKDDLCHKVGSYCAKKFLGLCIKKYKVYCCFHSKLGRIIQEQGRPQLAIEWGDAKDPNCRGFTPDEFQKLDFSKMDFSEFFEDIRHKAVEEVRGNVVKGATQKIQQFYK